MGSQRKLEAIWHPEDTKSGPPPGMFGSSGTLRTPKVVRHLDVLVGHQHMWVVGHYQHMWMVGHQHMWLVGHHQHMVFRLFFCRFGHETGREWTKIDITHSKRREISMRVQP